MVKLFKFFFLFVRSLFLSLLNYLTFFRNNTITRNNMKFNGETIFFSLVLKIAYNDFKFLIHNLLPTITRSLSNVSNTNEPKKKKTLNEKINIFEREEEEQKRMAKLAHFWYSPTIKRTIPCASIFLHIMLELNEINH